jgi:capsular polysaccharide transport system permease protein
MPEAPDAWADIVQLVELSRPGSIGLLDPPPPPPPEPSRFWRTALRFLLLVVLPTVVAGLYFAVFAADRYLAEAHFVVRKPNAPMRSAGPSLGSFDEGPKAFGGDDSYAVRDFLLSRDAMRLVIDRAGLRADLERAGHDPFWAFPGLLNGSSNERLYRLYKSLVSVDYETTTGVTTLRVQAFSPDAARRIADTLMAGGEDLINTLNNRARGDAVRVAEAEVERTKAKARQALAAVTAFRNRESMVDPLALAKGVFATIAGLTAQQAEAATQLDVLRQASPNSPQIAPLRMRLAALQRQIDEQRGILAGGDDSFTPRIAEYERLSLEEKFAAKSFVSALSLLELARLDMLRQQAYLDPVVTPHAADEEAYPYRLAWTGAILFSGLLLFWVFRPTPPPARRRALRNA